VRGHIRKKTNKSYEIAIYMGRDPETKKPKYMYERVRGTKKDAEARLAELLSRMNQGENIKPQKMTFGEFLDRWLDERVKKKNRPSTVQWYEGIANNHLKPELGHIGLRRLTALDLDRYYNKLREGGRKHNNYGQEMDAPLSESTIRAHHRAIYAALEQAYRWGLVRENVAKRADAYESSDEEVKPVARALTKEEVLSLLSVAAKHSRHQELYLLAITTGMRRGELLGLRRQDIRPPYANVRQTLRKSGPNPVFGPPKTKKGVRRIYLPEEALEAIERVLTRQEEERDVMGDSYEDHDLVFAQPNGRPLDGHNLSRRELPRLAKLADLGHVRFHDLRHTNATLCHEIDIPVRTSSERLGHDPAVHLRVYTHATDSMQAHAAKVLSQYLFGDKKKGQEEDENKQAI
jgi:integrase